MTCVSLVKMYAHDIMVCVHIIAAFAPNIMMDGPGYNDVPLVFHLCCFYLSAILAVGVPFPFGV